VPEWLDKEPDLLPGDEFYVDAFWELCTCRALGMSIGPIPWRDVVSYAEYVELEHDLISVFVRAIRALDNIYLVWVEKKSGSKKDKKPGRRPKSPRKVRKR
jgi:hypothetical protein